jgi:hypothetical protein
LNGANSSSPICNIYSGISAASSTLPEVSTGYYRIDLRGNSISPSLPQYHKFAAIAKFNSNGEFQSLCCAHQLINGSVLLDLIPSISINKGTGELYMSVRAQGYIGTNATSGTQLNKLYVNSFSRNDVSGANYDIIVSNTFNATLEQPQNILAVIKYNSALQAQSMAYVNTPPTQASFSATPGNTGSGISTDSSGNIYLATTIKDITNAKTIYTFNNLSGSDVVFSQFGTVSATSSTTDSIILSYNSNLTSARWATIVSSSDGLDDGGVISVVSADNYIYIGGNSTLNSSASSNTIAINSYSTVTGGAVQNTLFGNVDVTGATDRAGFIIKYE